MTLMCLRRRRQPPAVSNDFLIRASKLAETAYLFSREELGEPVPPNPLSAGSCAAPRTTRNPNHATRP
ncbi:MAG: hypothetical protein LBD24_04485 [Spirochaetaceae bacterium]|nr:hypothetical protein [Spirochaetaceae bacterium]